jgi:hypothetical protein
MATNPLCELYGCRSLGPGQDEQDWLRAEQDQQDWLRAEREIFYAAAAQESTSTTARAHTGGLEEYPWIA